MAAVDWFAKNLIESQVKNLGANDTVAAVIPYLIYWHALFWVCKLFSGSLFPSYIKLDNVLKSYWAASMVSSIHAMVIVPMALNALTYMDFHDVTTLSISSPQSSQVNVIFIGYLLNDILGCLYYNNKWAGYQATLIHHIVGIACWYIMTEGQFGHVLGQVGLLTEITTPFVNQRFFFDKGALLSYLLILCHILSVCL